MARSNGTVLTFTNVTAFRASAHQAIYERECTKAILNTVGDPLVVLSVDHRIQSGNRAFYTMFAVSRDEAQGASLYELGQGAFALAPLRKQIAKMLTGGHSFQSVDVDDVATATGRRSLSLDAHPLAFPGHSERRALVTFQDITARKQAEAAKDRALGGGIASQRGIARRGSTPQPDRQLFLEGSDGRNHLVRAALSHLRA